MTNLVFGFSEESTGTLAFSIFNNENEPFESKYRSTYLLMQELGHPLYCSLKRIPVENLTQFM
jgi:hypothetical protein